MTPEERNEIVNAICKVAVERTQAPIDGMYVLCAACYAFWAMNKNKGFQFADWLDQVTETFEDLHALNSPKGNA